MNVPVLSTHKYAETAFEVWMGCEARCISDRGFRTGWRNPMMSILRGSYVPHATTNTCLMFATPLLRRASRVLAGMVFSPTVLHAVADAK